MTKTFVSVVASLALAANIAANDSKMLALEKYQHAKVQMHTKDKSAQKISLKEYEKLCEEVCQSLDIYVYALCKIEKLDKKSKKELSNILHHLKLAENEAQKRFAELKLSSDEKVLFYAKASIHILEALLDDEFLSLTQGYKKPQDLFEFGKGLA